MNENPTATPSDPPEPTPETPAVTPQEAPETPPEAGPPPTPPPAAKIVLEGKRTEREAALEREIKARERRIADLEDENGQLKAAPKLPQNRPAPPKKAGWTFFDED